jgi:bifunctional non-homologous end joining protein LigD
MESPRTSCRPRHWPTACKFPSNSWLEQNMAKRQHLLEVEGHNLSISNPDKVLYPGAGFTKTHVIDYYVRVSDYLLPHVKDRPITLKRYPDGVQGAHFYEKDAPAYTPAWISTFPVPRRTGGTDIRYILINDLATLVWCGNLANLEIHPFLHRVPDINAPTEVVFDLDPGEDADILTCAKVARLVKAVLEKLELQCFAKVSGSKGIQLHVPLNTPVNYSITQSFARTLAELVASEHPDLVVSEMAKSSRKGRVFIDWSQNSDFKTTVGVYSLRAKQDRPFVSMPVTWEELLRAERSRNAGRLYFEPEAALKRLSKTGDLFAPVLTLRQQLPAEVIATIREEDAAPEPEPKTPGADRRKRGFSKTAEPVAIVRRRSGEGARRRFVKQKQAAKMKSAGPPPTKPRKSTGKPASGDR